MILVMFLTALVIGLIPASIAQSKGHDFFAWYVYGVLLFIVALIHALVLGPDHAGLDRRATAGGALMKCPRCAELIRREAKVCRFCSHEIVWVKQLEPGQTLQARMLAEIDAPYVKKAAPTEVPVSNSGD